MKSQSFYAVCPLEIGDELVYDGRATGGGILKFKIVEIRHETIASRPEGKFMFQLALTTKAEAIKNGK